MIEEKEIAVSPEELAEKGTRNDKGKSALHLIPPDVLYELGILYAKGAEKYSPDNWRRGMEYSRMYSSTFRHLLKFWAGEENDPIDGQHHLDSVIWGAVGLRYFQLHRDRYERFDDRFVEEPGKSLKLLPHAISFDNEEVFKQACQVLQEQGVISFTDPDRCPVFATELDEVKGTYKISWDPTEDNPLREIIEVPTGETATEYYAILSKQEPVSAIRDDDDFEEAEPQVRVADQPPGKEPLYEPVVPVEGLKTTKGEGQE
jgi:hypothetical protein